MSVRIKRAGESGSRYEWREKNLCAVARALSAESGSRLVWYEDIAARWRGSDSVAQVARWAIDLGEAHPLAPRGCSLLVLDPFDAAAIVAAYVEWSLDFDHMEDRWPAPSFIRGPHRLALRAALKEARRSWSSLLEAPAPAARPRSCLRCAAVFPSEGPGNRICERCSKILRAHLYRSPACDASLAIGMGGAR